MVKTSLDWTQASEKVVEMLTHLGLKIRSAKAETDLQDAGDDPKARFETMRACLVEIKAEAKSLFTEAVNIPQGPTKEVKDKQWRGYLRDLLQAVESLSVIVLNGEATDAGKAKPPSDPLSAPPQKEEPPTQVSDEFKQLKSLESLAWQLIDMRRIINEEDVRNGDETLREKAQSEYGCNFYFPEVASKFAGKAQHDRGEFDRNYAAFEAAIEGLGLNELQELSRKARELVRLTSRTCKSEFTNLFEGDSKQVEELCGYHQSDFRRVERSQPGYLATLVARLELILQQKKERDREQEVRRRERRERALNPPALKPLSTAGKTPPVPKPILPQPPQPGEPKPGGKDNVDQNSLSDDDKKALLIGRELPKLLSSVKLEDDAVLRDVANTYRKVKAVGGVEDVEKKLARLKTCEDQLGTNEELTEDRMRDYVTKARAYDNLSKEWKEETAGKELKKGAISSHLGTLVPKSKLDQVQKELEEALKAAVSDKDRLVMFDAVAKEWHERTGKPLTPAEVALFVHDVVPKTQFDGAQAALTAAQAATVSDADRTKIATFDQVKQERDSARRWRMGFAIATGVLGLAILIGGGVGLYNWPKAKKTAQKPAVQQTEPQQPGKVVMPPLNPSLLQPTTPPPPSTPAPSGAKQ